MHQENIGRIVSGNEQLAAFWSKSHGWAPLDAAELMSVSRLDWQVELSKTLYIWNFQSSSQGQLILAWANLGALIEGTLQLFLSVYLQDYAADPNHVKFKDEMVGPESLTLEKLKQYYQKQKLLGKEWFPFIEKVQQRRNAIHAFKNRNIGDKEEFEECTSKYLELLQTVNSMLPYPDLEFEPRF